MPIATRKRNLIERIRSRVRSIELDDVNVKRSRLKQLERLTCRPPSTWRLMLSLHVQLPWGRWSWILLLLVLGLGTGCRGLQQYGALTAQPNLAPDQLQYANPLIVPMMDRWLIMEQVADEVDDYFQFQRDIRIGVHDGIMSEGWIETYPRIGGTILEPWRRDSTPGFERLHATLQTVRRFAKVRVIPSGNNYQIDVKVYKEVEDLPQPLGASVGGQLIRHDSSLDIDQGQQPLSQGVNTGWVPMGRDLSLEQTILRNIQARIANLLRD